MCTARVAGLSQRRVGRREGLAGPAMGRSLARSLRDVGMGKMTHKEAKHLNLDTGLFAITIDKGKHPIYLTG